MSVGASCIMQLGSLNISLPHLSCVVMRVLWLHLCEYTTRCRGDVGRHRPTEGQPPEQSRTQGMRGEKVVNEDMLALYDDVQCHDWLNVACSTRSG